MGYISFEELEVYHAAREFRKKIYKLIKGLPPEDIIFKKTYSFVESLGDPSWN